MFFSDERRASEGTKQDAVAWHEIRDLNDHVLVTRRDAGTSLRKLTIPFLLLLSPSLFSPALILDLSKMAVPRNNLKDVLANAPATPSTKTSVIPGANATAGKVGGSVCTFPISCTLT